MKISKAQTPLTLLLPWFLAIWFLIPHSHADDWGGLATISTTMGVNEGRLCLGESTRGDLGCPTYAPYVSRANSYVGLGTENPMAPLHVYRNASNTNASVIVQSVDRNADVNLVSKPSGLTSVYFRRTDSTDPTNQAFLQYAPALGLFKIGVSDTSLLSLVSSGYAGIGTQIPTAMWDVRGTLRLANGGETCDTNRTGAIKYQSNDFHLCRNGTTWESLTSIGGGGTPDQIISGSAFVKTHENGSVTISGTTYLSSYGTNNARLAIGAAAAGNRYAYIDLVGDTTYTDYGFRIIRSNTGSNTTSSIQHRGTGGLFLQTLEAAPIILATSNTEAIRITPNGNVGIGYSAPAYSLDVVSSSQTTDATVARFLSHAPVSGFSKTNIRLMKSTLYGAELSGYLNQGIDSGFVFSTIASGASTERIRISSNGNTGIGTATPTTALDVSGTVSATTLQLAESPANPCNAANRGMAKVVNGRIYVCRYP